MDDAEARLTARGEKLLRRLVDRSVRDDDHLDVLAGKPLGEHAADHADVLDDLFAPVVNRQDRRQHRFDCNPRRA